MKDNVIRMAVCPLCGKTYHGVPALSRTDNETLICPDCGTRQALQSIGVDASVEERTKLGQTEHFCHISLSDEGLPLMKLSLFAPNRIHAEMMAERFRKDPLTVYQKVLQILTGTDDNSKDTNKTTEE